MNVLYKLDLFLSPYFQNILGSEGPSRQANVVILSKTGCVCKIHNINVLKTARLYSIELGLIYLKVTPVTH